MSRFGAVVLSGLIQGGYSRLAPVIRDFRLVQRCLGKDRLRQEPVLSVQEIWQEYCQGLMLYWVLNFEEVFENLKL